MTSNDKNIIGSAKIESVALAGKWVMRMTLIGRIDFHDACEAAQDYAQENDCDVEIWRNGQLEDIARPFVAFA